MAKVSQTERKTIAYLLCGSWRNVKELTGKLAIGLLGVVFLPLSLSLSESGEDALPYRVSVECQQSLICVWSHHWRTSYGATRGYDGGGEGGRKGEVKARYGKQGMHAVETLTLHTVCRQTTDDTVG